jgi:hypothetical protein
MVHGHMTSILEKLDELDRAINGKVRFRDGSTVEICVGGPHSQPVEPYQKCKKKTI